MLVANDDLSIMDVRFGPSTLHAKLEGVMARLACPQLPLGDSNNNDIKEHRFNGRPQQYLERLGKRETFVIRDLQRHCARRYD